MAKKNRGESSVPCMRVVIGGKPGARGHDSAGCAIVGESRGGATKFDLATKYGSTSKTVATPRTNKPCFGALKRKGCPVQLAFDKGQPFLRFCTSEKKPGLRIDVNSPADAQAKAEAACKSWKETGSFGLPEHTPLATPGERTAARRSRPPRRARRSRSAG